MYIENIKKALLTELSRCSYKHDPLSLFLLSSGKYSSEYLDCKLTLSRPHLLQLIGPIFLNELLPNIDAVGGLTMGADAISISISLASHLINKQINWFSVRKENKHYSTRKSIEGNILPCDTVAIIDDIITTGASTIKAVNTCKKYGLKIAQVIVLVDRQEFNGLENIKNVIGDIPIKTIFTKNEIKTERKNLM